MQSIMEKLPKLPDKKKLVAGAAAVVLAAAGWQLYSSITHKPQEANYIPIVRTMTIGESIAYSSARCADVMKASWPFRLPAESLPVLST